MKAKKNERRNPFNLQRETMRQLDDSALAAVAGAFTASYDNDCTQSGHCSKPN
jgi:hypothetical protein